MIVEEFMSPEPGKHIIRVVLSNHVLKYTRYPKDHWRYLSPENIELLKVKAVEAADKAYQEFLETGQYFQGVATSVSTDLNIMFVTEQEPTDPTKWTFVVESAVIKKGFIPKPNNILIKVSARRATHEGHEAIEIGDAVYAVDGAFQSEENFSGVLQEIVAQDASGHLPDMKPGPFYHLGSEDGEAEYVAAVDEVRRIFILDAYWKDLFHYGMRRMTVG